MGFHNPFFSLLGGAAWLNPQLRASNEGLFRPRVARAKGVHQATPLSIDCPFPLLL